MLSLTTLVLALLAVASARFEAGGMLQHHAMAPVPPVPYVAGPSPAKVQATRVIPGINALILAHIILESVAFCFFMPLGIFFAVFRFHPKVWFPVHVVCNVLGAACAIAGFVVIVIEVAQRNVNHFAALQDSPTNGTHPMLGLILIAMLVVQAVLGVAANLAWRRQLLYEPARVHTPIVARIHQAWGRLTFITSIAEVFLGVREALLADWVYGVYGGFYGLLAVAAIAMHFMHSRHRWRTLFYHEKPAMAVVSRGPVAVSTAAPVVAPVGRFVQPMENVPASDYRYGEAVPVDRGYAVPVVDRGYAVPAHHNYDGQPMEVLFDEGRVHLS